ncbi:MAG: ATP-dependent Clp protease adaptor ClpS, partial [Bacteroidales bacterium]|nr:ATP-dependent Clp protease adaptor ClpS [Bacteroidales bacterium]
AQEQTGVKERTRTRLREPKQYNVIFHNDDFTTMEFVVMVLAVVFHKSEADAERIMLDVHRHGQGVAGIYTYDIAVTKAQKATQMARNEDFPLRISIQPID